MYVLRAMCYALHCTILLDVLVRLRLLARLEAELLFREYKNYPGVFHTLLLSLLHLLLLLVLLVCLSEALSTLLTTLLSAPSYLTVPYSFDCILP